MKGGVAAMLGAARAVAEGGGLDAGRLIVACVVDEEHSSIGADALVTRWRADAAVVTEPTDLDIAVAHKGFEWSRDRRPAARAAHGSRPGRRQRRDCAHGAGAARARGARPARCSRGRRHPLLGTASLHASLIHGGHELSSYPDRCTLQFERRTLPGEPIRALAGEVEALLTPLAAADPAFDRSRTARCSHVPPYEIDAAHPLPGLLDAAARPRLPRRHHRHELLDRCRRARCGRHPAVLFGPIGAGLHGVDEWVDLARRAEITLPRRVLRQHRCRRSSWRCHASR